MGVSFRLFRFRKELPLYKRLCLFLTQLYLGFSFELAFQLTIFLLLLVLVNVIVYTQTCDATLHFPKHGILRKKYRRRSKDGSQRCPGRPLTLNQVEDAIRQHRELDALRIWIQTPRNLDMILPRTGLAPLELALESSNAVAMKWLLDRGANADTLMEDGLAPIFVACTRGLFECVILLVEHGADISYHSPEGLTCLLVAAKNKHFAVVYDLLEQKHCCVNDIEKNGFCALHYTSRFNHAPTTSKLICEGATIDAKNAHGESPLFLAAKHCCLDSLKVLLEAGADPNACTKDWDFALINAIERRHVEVMQLLLVSGVNIEQKCSHGRTPLQVACHSGFLGAVMLLVKHGADIAVRSPEGLTCILIAAEKQQFAIVTYLLKQTDCTVNDVGKNGHSVLHYTSRFNHARTTSKLISKGANIDALNKYGESPLFLAAKHGCLDSLKVLLEAGADPSIGIQEEHSGVKGHCTLHEAVSQGNLKTVEILVKYKANVEAIRSDGLSPIDIALALTPLRVDIASSLLKSSTASEQVKRLASRCLMAEQAAPNRQPYEADCICCPITLEVMRDPVIAADGHTYERQAIEEWLLKAKESPVTGQRMDVHMLIPNLAIKHVINNAQIQQTSQIQDSLFKVNMYQQTSLQ